MKSLLLSLTFFCLTAYSQFNFQPTYNLSNTSYATSDYHSVYTEPGVLGPGVEKRFYLVWGDNGQIKFKSSSDLGATWTPNKTVSTTANTCGWPVVISDQNKVVVLYHELVSSNYNVICQRSTDYGLTWSAPMRISDVSSAITPQIAYDGTRLYAVWEERPNNNYEIYLSYSDDFGATWTLTPMNLSNSPGSSRWVQIQATGGNIYCAWIEGSTYPLSDIYFRKSTNSGTTWSDVVNITNDARPQNRFYMTAHSNRIYLACDDIPGAFNYDEIYLIKSVNGGATWSSAVNITNNPGHSNTPCIALYDAFWILGNDLVYFTWADNSNTTPVNSDIFFKWSSNGGETWQDSLNLSNNPESSSRPRICISLTEMLDQTAALTIIWYDYSTGDAEILARNAFHTIVPVELASFNAEAENNNVHLSWLTATEINNRGFEVERKRNDTWETLTFIPGYGTTTEPKSYSYTDYNLPPETFAYRLKQIDFDGTYEYSKEVEVDIDLIYNFSLEQNYPNPFNPVTSIKYNVGTSGAVKLSVYDLLGNEIAVLVNEQKSPGSYQADFNGSSLASGTYIYRLTGVGNVVSKKLVLLK
jgi:hypothetical protein